MEKNKLKTIISIIINCVIVLSCAYGVYLQSLRDGITVLKWYTDLCNIFAGITALLCVIFHIRSLKNNSETPFAVKLLNYFSSSGLALTFMVVAFVLAPTRGPNGHYEMMLSSFGLWLHTVSPILAVINFIAFETKPELKFKSTFLAILPTLFYAFVIIILNLCYVLEGPYFFLKVRSQSVIMSIVWIIVLSAASYLFNFILWIGNKKVSEKAVKTTTK